MGAPHHLHGFLDMAPLLRFLDIAIVFTGLSPLRRCRNRRGAVLFEDLTRDRVNLRFRHHGALPGSTVNPAGTAAGRFIKRLGTSSRSASCRTHFATASTSRVPAGRTSW